MKNRTGMVHAFFTACIIFVMLAGCTPRDAQGIVDDAIKAHGGNSYKKFSMSFRFRDRDYTCVRNEGMFTYTRSFKDSLGNHIVDVLNNDGFQRTINDSVANLTTERADAYKNSVNSVIYFALLPYGLNDPAVRKELVNEATIKNKTYDVVRITFDQQGGGKDFEDEFMYWFNQDTHRMDYLAYRYHTDGGGIRFRETVNIQNQQGILVQDYINYKVNDIKTPLESLAALFEQGTLEKLSEIKIENLQISLE